MSANANIQSKLMVISSDQSIPRNDGSYIVSNQKLSRSSYNNIVLRTATLRNIFYNIVSLGDRKNNTFQVEYLIQAI